jgi:ParB family chromosome partitioning protein
MSEIEKIPLNRIFVSPDNPIREFDEQALKKLADSIKKHGLTQPIMVRPKNGGYELIIGESRFRACKMIGLTEIDARVETLDDSTAMEMRLIENTHRTDLIDAEKGDAVYALIERFPDKYPTIKDLADAIGKPLGTVTAWTQKSERLAESVRELVGAHKITEKAANYLLKYNNDIQSKLANIAANYPLKEPQAIKFFQLYDLNPHESLSRARYLASIKLVGAAESNRRKKKA